MSDSIGDIATRHQVMLEGLKAGKAKDYLKVAKKLEADIINTANNLGVDSMDQLTKKELNTLITSLTATNKKYQDAIVKDLDGDLQKLAKSDAIFEQESINYFLKSKVATSAADVAYSAALLAPISATGDLLKPFIGNWSKTRINQVNGAIRNGYKEGLTLQQMTQRIRGTRANNFRDGLTNLQTRQAQAVIRTSVQHVSSTARMATLERNKDIIKAYVWKATLDGRTTPRCRSLDGQEFEMGRGPLPPIHVNCRSTFNYVLDDKLELEALDEGATRASSTGPVPANTTYYEWLKEQKREFQESVIGKQRTIWLNDGRLTAQEFARMNLNKNFKQITLKEFESKRTELITNKFGKKALTGQAAIDKKFPRANTQAIDTFERFYRNGQWTPERQKLHDEIVDAFFEEKRPVRNPVARMTGGGPASGKSAIIKNGSVKVRKNSVTIDSDEIKKFLPEYNHRNKIGDASAAAFSHEESSYLSKVIMNKASREKYNLFLDGTGDSSLEKLTKKSNQMRQGGQKLIADYVTVDTEEAIRRNVARFEKTGRMVPNSFVRETHANISELFPQALADDLFDEVTLWDTNTFGEVIKIMDRKEGVTTIYDEPLWQKFLNKASDR